MHLCRVCSEPTSIFADYGKMPLANGFLTPEQVPAERFYRLAMAYCDHCGMIQLVDSPAPDEMFHDNYAYFAQTSRGMIDHFRAFATEVMERERLDSSSLVVELGSNDGIMLKNYAAASIRHLGVDPSGNVAAAANAAGVRTMQAFFSHDTAQAIRAQEGPADVVTGANVIAHIPDINSVGQGVRALLKDSGVFVFEAPYAGDVIANTAFDQFYDEHIFLLSLRSVSNAFSRHGLELFDVSHQSTHGGTMRFWLAPTGTRLVRDSVIQWTARENELGMSAPETYTAFSRRCERLRERLRAVLEQAKAEGKRVVGYGATAKATTIANYCGIGPDLVEFISDTTPTKQGKLSPGMHIPVQPYSQFEASYPDFALLFAWNHAKEIMAKEQAFMQSGGRWILYVPDVAIV